MGAPMGHAAKSGVIKETTFNTSPGAVTYGLEFDTDTIRATASIVTRDGMRGTRSRHSSDTRTGITSVGGTLTCRPTPEDLAVLFPFILGADASGTSFALAETLPSFKYTADRVTKVFSYLGCKVNRATFRGTRNAGVQLSLDVIGASEVVAAAGTFPGISINNTLPYLITDGVLTLQSSSRQFDEFELVIDNHLDGDNFKNATALVDLDPTDRSITLRTTHDYNSTNSDLYAQALAGAAGTLVFTNAGYSTTLTFGTLQVPAETPVVDTSSRIPLALSMTARHNGTNPELAVTHDSTP